VTTCPDCKALQHLRDTVEPLNDEVRWAVYMALISVADVLIGSVKQLILEVDQRGAPDADPDDLLPIP
jgi:hypothetical protein